MLFQPAQFFNSGKINNSLMNLRRCIEKLRENQKSGKNGAVPYRDDRLTHLFRNYFEGIGSVKMIVCVNPRQADFDENVNVMQFAEMASEVHIERVDPVPRELRLTPGQKKAKEAIQEALRKASSKTDLGAGGNPSYRYLAQALLLLHVWVLICTNSLCVFSLSSL